MNEDARRRKEEMMERVFKARNEMEKDFNEWRKMQEAFEQMESFAWKINEISDDVKKSCEKWGV